MGRATTPASRAGMETKAGAERCRRGRAKGKSAGATVVVMIVYPLLKASGSRPRQMWRGLTLALALALSLGLLLSRPSAQSAQRPASLTGTIIDEDSNQPIPGAVVYLGIQGKGSAGLPRLVTDEKGRFVFSPLSGGSGYFVSASKPGWFDGGYLSTTGSSLSLKDGQQVTVTIRLQRTSGISGFLRDQTGEAVVGGLVRAIRRVPIGDSVHLVVSGTSPTNDLGEFRIGGLREGEYLLMGVDVGVQIQATKAAFAAAAFAPNAVTDQLAETVSLGPGEENSGIGISLSRAPGVLIQGQIVGVPVPPGSPVYLLPSTELAAGPELALATGVIDRTGHFRFLGVPAGRFKVITSGALTTYFVPPRVAPDVPFLTSPWSGVVASTWISQVHYKAFAPPEGTAAWYAEEQIDVNGTERTQIQLTSKQGVAVSGEVVTDAPDPTGQSALVYAEPANGEPFLGVQVAIMQRQRFRFPGLVPGHYFLRVARMPGFVVRSVLAAGEDLTTHPLDLTSGAEVRDVRIDITRQGATITGSIIESAASWQVSVVLFPCSPSSDAGFGISSPAYRSTRAMPGGRFRIPDLPADSYCVAALKPQDAADWPARSAVSRLRAQAARVTVSAGQTVTVDLKVVGGK
jgi:hypothetical protein